jgi:hypothetical protein
LSGKVSFPRSNGSSHIRGVAFDAVITGKAGQRLNPMTGPVFSELLNVAGACGFKNPPANDGVHWQIIV